MHGAFYGMSAIMERLSANSPGLAPLNPQDFDLTYKTEYTLPVALFPINE